jgi:Family of unknown function (DUF6600)/BON domain
MNMKNLRIVILLSAILLTTFGTARAAVSFTIGTNDFYVSVGDYDYLPYAYQADPGFVPPQINFYEMMGQYGNWVQVPPFGNVWQPYAFTGWRPYTYGHWVYTSQYGPMWQGYEPWAWAGYHYGNWVFSRGYGWVWVPGYDWHPGRVAWAQGYDTIGWMPLPPDGYDYSRGDLAYVGPSNQFSYSDNDFGMAVDSNSFSYGGPYYDPRYRNMYYNPAYENTSMNLWVFIGAQDFTRDNYADYSLAPDYARYAFDQRAVRVTSRPVERTVLERIVRQPIQVTQVEERQLQTEKRPVKVVVPTSAQEVEKVQRHSKEVVQEVIAPAFAEKQKEFKGQNAKNKDAVTKIFRQENVQPKTQTVSSEELVTRAKASQANREEQRRQKVNVEKEKFAQLQKEGKVRESNRQNRSEQPQDETPNPRQMTTNRPIPPPPNQPQQQERKPDQTTEDVNKNPEREMKPNQPEPDTQEPRAKHPEPGGANPNDRDIREKETGKINDSAIASKIRNRVANDELLRGSRINVQSNNGQVILTGMVSSKAEERRAIEIAQNVENVRSVRSNLEIRKSK